MNLTGRILRLRIKHTWINYIDISVTFSAILMILKCQQIYNFIFFYDYTLYNHEYALNVFF